MGTLKSLGQDIAAARAKATLTQAQLADKAGVSLIYVKKLESGERAPSLPMLDRIARALGLALDVRFIRHKGRA
jgi:transcriptional regulator with XRE-family HTH domain